MNLSFITKTILCTTLGSAFPLTGRPLSLRLTFQAALYDEIRASHSLLDNIPFTSRSASIRPQHKINSNKNDCENRSGYAPVSQSTGQVGTYGVIGETVYDRNAPIDYNSQKSAKPAPFVPHSSTGAGGSPTSPASPSQGNVHAPIDYNSCKSFSLSENEMPYPQNASVKPIPTIPHLSTGARGSSRIGSPTRSHHVPIDYNSCKSFSVSENEMIYFQNSPKQSPSFSPHSSTGAGGAPMSEASPSFRSARNMQ